MLRAGAERRMMLEIAVCVWLLCCVWCCVCSVRRVLRLLVQPFWWRSLWACEDMAQCQQLLQGTNPMCFLCVSEGALKFPKLRPNLNRLFSLTRLRTNLGHTP